jgi:hypothetical protein
MRLPSFVIEVAVLAALFSLILRKWKSESACLARSLAAAEMSFARSLKEAVMPDVRGNRALAIALAAMSFRGEALDIEKLLGLADEYLQYIEGDDDAQIPRPDKLAKGRMPKP